MTSGPRLPRKLDENGLYVVDEAYNRLLKGQSGASVLKYMRPHYTRQTLAGKIGVIKKRLMLDGYRNPEYNDKRLRRYEKESPVKRFLAAPLRTQYLIHKRRRKLEGWSKRAIKTLCKIKLLPANMEAFRLEDSEMKNIKRDIRAAKFGRMRDVVRVPNAKALQEKATALLENVTVKHTLTQICCSLALVSGRRATELLNQRSTFTIIGEFSVMFDGQLKKPLDQCKPYPIPLLCKAEVFVNAVTVLREKQGDVSHLDNDAIHNRFKGAIAKGRINKFVPGIPTFHAFRSMYWRYVHVCYDHSCAEPYLAMRILGHSDEYESTHYVSVLLEDTDGLSNVFGPLAFDKNDC